VTDNCDAAPVCSLSVSSNEGEGGPDWQIVNAHEVELLAERMGSGNGRVYTIQISCKDKLPLSSMTSVTVSVPHDQRH
jgi:hypothetical protein